MGESLRSYHFSLKKDHGWLWVVTIPVGLCCWVIPFVICWGLIGTGLSQGTATIIAFLFLGIPAYMIGWIFVYSFMEVIITRVSFSDSTIYHRAPLLLIPILWRTKKIKIADIENINFSIRSGSRSAILVLFHRGNKVKKHLLPRFKDQPEYLQEFKTFDIKDDSPVKNNQIQNMLNAESTSKEQKLEDAFTRQNSIHSWNQFIKFFGGILIFTLLIGCGYYCLQLPFSPYESFSAGVIVGMALVFISLVISFPIIGQGLIWIFGRKAIILFFSFLNIQSNSLFIPANLQQLIYEWVKWKTSSISLTEFAFWCSFLLSILYSIDRIVRHSMRKSKTEIF